ncbi:hypothetical protein [Hymenobacter terrenus]|uniref:hypothetical protein n=1 Tax=Hymenobacter terrenus TaxID=1629124 RepID=UPI000696A760|nr:hypothetical protein [Hymenobacter terrenus]
MKPNPWRWDDIGVVEIVLILAALFFLASAILVQVDFRRASPETLKPEQSPMDGLGALFCALVLACGAYVNAYWNRRLRGECRYTVGWVYKHSRSKTGRAAHYKFWVRGVQFSSFEKVQWQYGGRPLGSRWYVRYAVADPEVCIHTRIQVPDSVRVVPPTGWATLPEPPPPTPPALPPAPRIPAAAPEPLTGPAASPVFRPGVPRPDSLPHPRFGPLGPLPLPGAASLGP